MASVFVHSSHAGLWTLVKRQHGVVARRQLLDLGFTAPAIRHRLARGRLHQVWRDVYAVGRPDLTLHGHWMAAVLTCGPEAVLSHGTAAALWGIRTVVTGEIEVSVPARFAPRREGLRVYRRAVLAPGEMTYRRGIPVTTPVRTLIDLARRLDRDQLEAAINEADKHDLTDPEALQSALDALPRQPGVRALRRTLSDRTLALTDSELERRFLPIAAKAGLPPPQTGRRVNGFKVDFFWPDLGLVVETDGLRYHRTAAQQARDRRRDQAHVAAGLTALRFTHAQVSYGSGEVEATLSAVARRLAVEGGTQRPPVERS